MEKRVRTGRKLYYIGFVALIGCLIAAELVWLPAPLELGGGMQWIEMLDWLYYGLSLIPLCWLAGAICLAAGSVPLALRAFRAIIILANAALAALIPLAPDALLLLLIGAAIAVIVVCADLLVSGRMALGAMPWRSVASVIGIVLLLGALLAPTGYSVTYPGMTLNLNRYAEVQGGHEGGKVEGVLVFEWPAVLADRLYGLLFPQYDFAPIPKDEPPLSETYAQVVAMKSDANQVAEAIAMQKAGIGDGVMPDGIAIIAIVKDSPADGKLQAGDVVRALNGVPVRSAESMIAYMEQSVKPGDWVDAQVERGSETITVKVPTAPSEQEAERAVFGVSVQTKWRFDTPRSVDFNEYMAHLGGPSHGAMLTLAFIDQLTAGGVTGELSIAGTGTIEHDGSIGMVGGIPQKAYAVSRTDADVFFVPAEGEAAAVSAAPSLNVVAVSHIDEVLSWLNKHVKKKD